MKDNWKDFFKGFSLFRTSLIQENYINTIKKYTPPKGKILEIAAGSGITSALLSDMGYNVTCTDIDDDLLNDIRDRFSGFDLIVENCDMFQAKKQYAKLQFNTIIHQGLLEHFEDEDIVKIIREQKDLANYLVFDIPNDKRTEKIQEYGNERFLSIDHWVNLFKEAGCAVIDIDGRRFEGILENNKYSLSKEERIRYGTSNTFVVKSLDLIPKKLHYGCGTVYLDGWFNVDAQLDHLATDASAIQFLNENKTTPENYYKHDFQNIVRSNKVIIGDFEGQINNLNKFLPNYFDEIIIYHVIEHIPRYNLDKFFSDLLNISSTNALFRFAVPDNIGLCELYLQSDTYENQIKYHDYIFGKQRDKYSHHFVGYSKESLHKTLSKYFKQVEFIKNNNDYPALWVVCKK